MGIRSFGSRTETVPRGGEGVWLFILVQGSFDCAHSRGATSAPHFPGTLGATVDVSGSLWFACLSKKLFPFNQVFDLRSDRIPIYIFHPIRVIIFR